MYFFRILGFEDFWGFLESFIGFCICFPAFEGFLKNIFGFYFSDFPEGVRRFFELRTPWGIFTYRYLPLPLDPDIKKNNNYILIKYWHIAIELLPSQDSDIKCLNSSKSVQVPFWHLICGGLPWYGLTYTPVRRLRQSKRITSPWLKSVSLSSQRIFLVGLDNSA